MGWRQSWQWAVSAASPRGARHRFCPLPFCGRECVWTRRAHTCTRACSYTPTYTRVQAYMQECVHMCARKHAYTRTHTRVHTCKHCASTSPTPQAVYEQGVPARGHTRGVGASRAARAGKEGGGAVAATASPRSNGFKCRSPDERADGRRAGGSAQTGPAPGLEPAAAAQRGARAEAKRAEGGACAGVPPRPQGPRHPQFLARSRGRKSAERVFLPRPLIRYQPLPFPRRVPSRFPTARKARRCFVSGGIQCAEERGGLPEAPPGLLLAGFTNILEHKKDGLLFLLTR